MKLRRETILIIGVILALALITAAVAYFQARQNSSPALSSNSNAPNGALVVRLWLSAAGYQVDNKPGAQFAIPPDTAAVLILQPSTGITGEEWNILDSWVRQGGILLLAANFWNLAFDGQPFKLIPADIGLREFDLFPTAPIFRSPPLTQPVHLLMDGILNYSGADGPVLFSTPAGPAAWQIHLGQGQLLAFTDGSFLSNAGLKTGGNAALAINLFSQIPPGSKVFIDEWHHGERVNNPTGYGPMAWLTQTPAGFAVTFMALVIFVGLFLAGRPFGQRVPLAATLARRGSLDYVVALANLNRRAGHRQAVMNYYYAELKRAFARRYRLDLAQADPDFISQVKQINPGLDVSGLGELLRRLRQKSFTETEMVQLARECAGWMDKIEGSTQ